MSTKRKQRERWIVSSMAGGKRKRKREQPASASGAIPGSKDEYYVEAVLQARESSGQQEFLVKWFGFPSSDNSWVPRVDMNEVCYARTSYCAFVFATRCCLAC